jgi:hypothetical protein
MKKALLLSIILFLLFSAPGVSKAQPFGEHGVVNPLGGITAGPVNGGLHFHSNPSEDHYAFESLEHHSYQYYALHGYEHYRGEELQHFDRFRDIQYPKDQPYSRPSFDSFFGVDSYNPLKW